MMRKKASVRNLSPSSPNRRKTRSQAKQEASTASAVEAGNAPALNPQHHNVEHSYGDEVLEAFKLATEPVRKIAPPSPAQTDIVIPMSAAFESDLAECSTRWKDREVVEGYAGLQASISNFRCSSPQTAAFSAQFEDLDGRSTTMELSLTFDNLASYPTAYHVLVSSPFSPPKRIKKTFERFKQIYGLTVSELVLRVISALQGDDEANGGIPPNGKEEETDEDMDEEMMFEGVGVGRPSQFGGFGESQASRSIDRTLLREQKQWATGPVSPSTPTFGQIISYSIPLTNLPIDPNTLAQWDDGLVEAWQEGKRFTLLVRIDQYPTKPDKMQYWLAFIDTYKPSAQDLVDIIRHEKHSFYLSKALVNHLKCFPRCYQIRCGWGTDWASADRIGLCEQKSKEVFKDNKLPSMVGIGEMDDPVARGWEQNVPLCAFYWVLRRFMEAPKYCQNCGLEVSVVSARPYVCEKELCLYAFMSLGRGPSLEHVIRTQPTVVDMLLSFAYTSASGATRMDFPLGLGIELPLDYNASLTSTLFDSVPNQRAALKWLLEKIPRVSAMKIHLDNGGTLHTLNMPAGSLGVLRWVVGSCRAYLKEIRSGEGVLNTGEGAARLGAPTSFKQFLFVLGSPEQETAFKAEIEIAKEKDVNVKLHPTMLVFHGSPTERWHNILRTGLDYNETAHGRAHGHGVYFAHEASTSLGGYSRASGFVRPNADYTATKAAALVGLVNVPSTFVSTSPYYVVNNVKQIKPFLLIVEGTNNGDLSEPSAKEGCSLKIGKGELFKHDPKLNKMAPLFFAKPLQVKMPEKLTQTTFIDDEEDDEDDTALFRPPTPPTAAIVVFTPSPRSRFDKLEILPPPTGTSVVATRALGKEFKAIVKAQAEAALPFYVDPEQESLYSWIIEMWDFGESKLKDELKAKVINSVIAEMRFPANFPHAPPFMRILHPRCLPFASGGGGNITAGGSVCNEILTMTGWNPAFTIEALVRDIMVNMTEATPPARLDMRQWNSGYGMREAIDAYKRVAAQHGWEVPKDFDKLT